MLILATSETAEWYRLPFEVTDEVTVADRFDVRMLLRARNDVSHAFVLQLSQGRVRLTEVTAAGVAEHSLALPDDHTPTLTHPPHVGTATRYPNSDRRREGKRFV